jgi:hypothetical protein
MVSDADTKQGGTSCIPAIKALFCLAVKPTAPMVGPADGDTLVPVPLMPQARVFALHAVDLPKRHGGHPV